MQKTLELNLDENIRWSLMARFSGISADILCNELEEENWETFQTAAATFLGIAEFNSSKVCPSRPWHNSFNSLFFKQRKV